MRLNVNVMRFVNRIPLRSATHIVDDVFITICVRLALTNIIV